MTGAGSDGRGRPTSLVAYLNEESPDSERRFHQRIGFQVLSRAGRDWSGADQRSADGARLAAAGQLVGGGRSLRLLGPLGRQLRQRPLDAAPDATEGDAEH